MLSNQDMEEANLEDMRKSFIEDLKSSRISSVQQTEKTLQAKSLLRESREEEKIKKDWGNYKQAFAAALQGAKDGRKCTCKGIQETR